jgi:hypothetical protein
MKVKKSSMSCNSILLCCMWTLPVSADWLDVIAESIEVRNLRTGQAGPNITAQEGDVLEISCTEFIDLYGTHEKWVASTPQRWENRVTVDGRTLAIFNGEMPQGTTLAKPKFASRPKTYPAVQWTASGIGAHEASCVLNQPKKISDHVAANNVINTLINVTAVPKTTVLMTTLPPPQSAAPQPTTTVQSAAQRAAVPPVVKQAPPAPVATSLVVEAETLIPTAVVSGGQMVRQDMAEYGVGWGGNAQLFWRPPTPDGNKPNLLTEFALPSAGTYDLVLYYTKAPDFGQFTVYVDGSMPTNQDGYGPQVALGQVSLGRHQLSAGRHELAFEVTGKNPRSTGYIIGVDRLQLNSVP